MNDGYPQDLVRHVAASTGLPETTARRVVADVVVETLQNLHLRFPTLTKALAESSGASPDHIQVVVQGIPAKHWGMAGKPGG